MEAEVDAELERALRAALADKGCDFQRSADVPGRGSREVERDSSADTAACDDRRDIVGIPVDTVACGRREQTGLSADLEDIRDMKRAAANEIPQSPFPDDVKR